MGTVVYRKLFTVTASSTQTVAFGRYYTNASFFMLSGTGSGAIKVAVKGAGGRNYVAIDPNRYDLSAGQPAQKIIDCVMDSVTLTSSGNAATVVMLVNAWNNEG